MFEISLLAEHDVLGEFCHFFLDKSIDHIGHFPNYHGLEQALFGEEKIFLDNFFEDVEADLLGHRTFDNLIDVTIHIFGFFEDGTHEGCKDGIVLDGMIGMPTPVHIYFVHANIHHILNIVLC